MEITRDDLATAVAEQIITSRQADELWAALERRAPVTPPDSSTPEVVRPRFDVVHVAYYFGALIVIGAMGWFMTEGWEALGGGGIFATACAYALGFLVIGRSLWRQQALRIPAGLLITIAVGMTPLAVYGFERWVGWWPSVDPGTYRGFHEWIKGGWLAMEAGTILAALVALRFYRFPFLTAPLAFAAWYMSMDLAPLLFGEHVTWNERAWVSVAVGLVALLAGYVVDHRVREDFAFWLYLFGLMAFWGGLTSMESHDEWRRLIYCLINLGLMVASVLLNRRTFMVFGALGVMGYLGDLSYRVFKDSLMFPFVLSGIGIAIIAAGIHYQRHRERYERALFGFVPESVRALLPASRA